MLEERKRNNDKYNKYINTNRLRNKEIKENLIKNNWKYNSEQYQMLVKFVY